MIFNIILTVDSVCLKHLETKLTDKDIPHQSSLATASLHTAAPLKMGCAEQVNVSQVVDHLKQLTTKRDTSDTSQASATISSPERDTKDTTQHGTGTNHGDEVSKESIVRSKVKGKTRDIEDDTRDMESNTRNITGKTRDMKGNSRDMKGNTTDRKDKLMAVDLSDTRAVWILENSKWEKLCGLSEECPYAGCIALVSDDLVILDKDVTLSFSLSTKQWKRLKQMPTSRLYSSAVVVDEKLIAIGGWANETESSVCEIFHVKQNKWSSAASLPVPLTKPLVAVLAGHIYILPLKDELSSTHAQLLMYDPLSNTYTHRARLPSNIDNTYGACLVGVTDMLYLLGGVEDLAWQYSPHTDQWIQLVTSTLRHDNGCCAVLRDNNILLCGGDDNFEEIDACSFDMIEEYNTVTQQWKILDIRLPITYRQDWSSVSNVM